MVTDIETLYRAESRRIFATLIQLLGDFDLAEEALHDAFKAAIEQWLTQGLDEQDRTLWSAAQIAEGCASAEQALRTPNFGAYSLQAAISAVHADAHTTRQTDWPQIVGLSDVLLSREPSPEVALNRAVAVAMASGPALGQALVTALLQDLTLQNYHLAHAAQADLLRRLGRHQEALGPYQHALTPTSQAAEQRFLQRKITDI